jgi:DNA-binding MarR family transcriptional regulator
MLASSAFPTNRSLVMTRSKNTGAPAPETANILAHWHDAVPHDRLAHLVKDAMRALVRALQMRLTEHEVSFGHWTFLRILWETDGLTQRELSAQAGVMEPTTFAAVKAMETLGYVSRQQMPDNKKKVHVFLTREGRALKKKLVPLAEEVNDIGVAGLTKRDIQIARKVLLTIIENLAADESGSDDPTRRVPSTRELGRLIAEREETLGDT